MVDMDAYIQRLVEADPLRASVLRSVIAALRLPPGSHGLDVGCGVGLQAVLLAEAVGEGGWVTGLDISPDMLRYGQGLMRERDAGERVRFVAGDGSNLPFASGSFDWVWSADCVGYPTGNLVPALRELVRVVRPGGTVALLAWTSQSLLPGYPLLEARLNATCSAYAPYLEGKPPRTHFMRALGAFREAGLESVRARTFVGEVQAPLGEDVRLALASLFEMLWDAPQPGVAPPDLAEYRRLCKLDSPSFIAGEPDYYAFFTYTLFSAHVPGAGGAAG